MKIIELLDREVASESAYAARTYAARLAADPPSVDDLTMLRASMAVLGITPADARADADALDEAARLRRDAPTEADVAEAERRQQAAFRAMTDLSNAHEAEVAPLRERESAIYARYADRPDADELAALPEEQDDTRHAIRRAHAIFRAEHERLAEIAERARFAFRDARARHNVAEDRLRELAREHPAAFGVTDKCGR